MMRNYIEGESLVIFDVVPRKEYLGADAYREDRWVRVTNGYRKVGGKWLIAMEHISVPVDMKRGKASKDVIP